MRKGSFHTPAHHGGDGISALIKKSLGKELFSRDLTELEGLDNLAQPSGPLLELEKAAAKLFGADHTFLSVNGATLANQAAMLAFLKPGDKVILQRDLHRSIYNGLIFTGAEPVYLSPEIHQPTGLPCGILPSTVEKAFLEHPDAKGLILSNPNYFGFVSDLKEIAAIIKKRDKILVVDEALGTLFPFSSALPPSALLLGADLVIHSGHKGLSGLTQTGLLHLKGEKISPEAVRQAINLLQSTSPSYPLLLSLESAILQMENEGTALIQKIKTLSNQANGLLASLPSIGRVPTPDVTKLLLDLDSTGISGYEAEKILSDQFEIIPETAGLNYLLFFLSFANTKEEIDHLANALKEMEHKYCQKAPTRTLPPFPFFPEKLMSPREAFFSAKETIPLAQAAGRIAGAMIISYPPGVPLIVPGELISSGHISYLESLIQSGGEVIGISDELQSEVLSPLGPLPGPPPKGEGKQGMS